MVRSYPAGELPPSPSRSITVETGVCKGGKREEFGMESDRLLDCRWYIAGDGRGNIPTMEVSIMSLRSKLEGSLNGGRTLLVSGKESYGVDGE